MSIKEVYDTREITCPKCGYEWSDSWEIDRNSDGDIGPLECYECNCEFNVERDLTVTYNTWYDDEFEQEATNE